MESFKKFAGFLSVLFGALLVSTAFWTGYQLNEIHKETQELQATASKKESLIRTNTSQLDRELSALEMLTDVTIPRLIENCVDFNIENGVSESRAQDYCDEEIPATEQSNLESSQERALVYQTEISRAELELSATNAAEEAQKIARSATWAAGLDVGVTLLAVWGVFQLAFLWGSHKAKTEAIRD